VCARITVTTTPAEIADLFGLLFDTSAEATRPRLNVAPSQLVPVVRAAAAGGRELVSMRWGLIPHWNTNPKHKGFLNARAATAATKPSFRDPFKYRRCLVPVGGFYEFEDRGGKQAQPYYVTSADGRPLAVAGLWDRWGGPDGAVEGVAVVTVEPNELLRPLHDRMPAVMSPGDFALWLDPRERDPARLLPLLRPCPAELMQRWPVGRRVNVAGVDEPRLTERVELPEATRQPSLFDVA
jgi:putative SOS response-associated peptidase YedK